MSSTRPTYDTLTYQANVSNSVGPGEYNLFKCAHENNNQCQIPYGCNASSSKRSSNSFPLMSNKQTDLDSVLKGINKIYTRTEVPSCAWKEYEKDIPKDCECNMKLVSEDTLLSNPKCHYRGMSIDRFYKPGCPASNPMSWRIGGGGIDTVQMAKDFWVEQLPSNKNATNKYGNDNVEYAYKSCCK